MDGKQSNPGKTSSSLLDVLNAQKQGDLMPITLLDGPTPDEILLPVNLRYDWRGFSFGNFWFGYYFGFSQPSPPVEERWAV